MCSSECTGREKNAHTYLMKGQLYQAQVQYDKMLLLFSCELAVSASLCQTVCVCVYTPKTVSSLHHRLGRNAAWENYGCVLFLNDDSFGQTV